MIFGNKKLKVKIANLELQLEQLERDIYGIPKTDLDYNQYHPKRNLGIKRRINIDRKVLAEVVDYVYREKK